MDMQPTIQPKSDQINSDDLISGPRTVRITKVSANEATPEQPVNVFFDGDGGKPFRPCKSMRRVMVAAWGPDASAYVGRSMTLYRDQNVKFGGMAVGGIRVSHMSHLERDLTIALTETRAKRAPYTVRKLAASVEPKADPPAADDETDTLEAARAAAERGKEAFRAWWAANAKTRGATKPIIDELRATAAEADARADDPFGLPPISPEAIAAAEAKARAAIAAQDAEENR